MLVDVPVGQSIKGLLQDHARFEARQVRTEAEMHAVTEGHVPIEVARDVETIGSVVLALVPSRRYL